MGKFMRALGNALLTVLVMILIVYGWAFIEMKLLLKSQPELFGYAFFLQPADDMMPDINKNDVVIIDKSSDYKVGDAILYFDGKDSNYKLHYISSLNKDSFVPKNSIDSKISEAISRDNIVGKAVRKVAFLGAVITFFKQKTVLIIIAIFGIAFLVISQYMEYKPKKKESIEN